MRRKDKTASCERSKNEGKCFAKMNRYRRSIAKIERKKKTLREWSCWEKGSYARCLLQFVISQVRSASIFYQIVAEKISRNARQVYTFHCRMVAQFGSIKSIILHYLRSKLNQRSMYPSETSSNSEKYSQNQENFPFSPNEKPINLDQISITLNIMQKRYLENMLLVQNSPDAEEDRFQKLQESGQWDLSESLYWQEQLNCI